MNLHQTLLTTPLGPMVALSNTASLYLLEFADRIDLEEKIILLAAKTGQKLVERRTTLHDFLQSELDQYFAGKLHHFQTKMHLIGTPFQMCVWESLRQIGYGKTISYAELATNIGKPTAYRAVANANGANPLCILVPCHRVIYSSGALGGYSGGLDRKPQLLSLERNMNDPK